MIYEHSRYRYCIGYRDADSGLVTLDEREPVRYSDQTDNRYHTVVDGDTWWGLAHRYLGTFARSSGLWWVIAEYQPSPDIVVDPTLRLQAGATVVIPSERFVRERVFSSEQRRFH